MSTSVKNKLSSEFVPDVKDSAYEFDRFDKAALRTIVSVLKLSVFTESYSNWSGAADLIFDAISERFLSRGLDVYCFIVSPNWKKDTKIVRHHGLGQTLKKDLKVDPPDILFEKEIVNNNEVIFYSVVKLSHQNSAGIFNFLSANENGVLFTNPDPNDSNFSILIQELAAIVAIKLKKQTNNLNIVEAINLILEKGFEALFPYAWEETGEYHLDIFQKRHKPEPDIAL